jgi:DNA-binding protein HU-beta
MLYLRHNLAAASKIRLILAENHDIYRPRLWLFRKTHMAAKPAKLAKPAKKAAKSAADKPDTVTLRHLGTALAEAHEMPKKQANAILEDLVGMLTKHLKKGARIRMTGLGILQVRKRAARMGRNPATGEAIKIKASKKVAFRASKELKEQV